MFALGYFGTEYYNLLNMLIIILFFQLLYGQLQELPFGPSKNSEIGFELYTSKNQTLDSNTFEKRNGSIIIERKGSKPLYVGVNLKNNVPIGKYVIVIEDCFIDNIVLIGADDNKLVGSIYPFNSRNISFHYPAFLIEKKNVTDSIYYLKIENNFHNSVIPIRVFTEKAFLNYSLKSYLFWGIYIGVLIITLLISVWMYLSYKKIIFVYVFLAILSGVIWVLFNNGLGFQFLWPNHPAYMNTGRFMFYQLSYLFVLICFQVFVKLNFKNKIEEYILFVLKGLLIISIFFSLNPFSVNNENVWMGIYFFYANSLLIISSLYMIFYLLKEIRNQNVNANFYLSSIIIIFLGTFGLILMKYEIIPPFNLILKLNYIGLFIQAISLLVGLMIEHFLQKKANTQLEINLMRAQSDERERIAIDMHDELGASLSTIKLVSELGIKQKDQNKLYETLEVIYDKSILINRKLKEIIWTLHSQNDTIESVIDYIIDYGKNYFKELGIDITISISSEIPHIAFDGLKRRHLILMIKEIFQNIAKHSGSDKATVEFSFKKNEFHLIIKDYGIGIDKNINQGNGIKNIYLRMEYIKGIIHFKNIDGAQYHLIIPL